MLVKEVWDFLFRIQQDTQINRLGEEKALVSNECSAMLNIPKTAFCIFSDAIFEHFIATAPQALFGWI